MFFQKELSSCHVARRPRRPLKEKKKMYHELHSFSMTLVQTGSDKNAHFLKSVFMYHCAYTHGFICFYSLDLFEFYGYLFCDPTPPHNCFLLEQQFTLSNSYWCFEKKAQPHTTALCLTFGE